jgi:hypothetical protein
MYEQSKSFKALKWSPSEEENVSWGLTSRLIPDLESRVSSLDFELPSLEEVR